MAAAQVTKKPSRKKVDEEVQEEVQEEILVEPLPCSPWGYVVVVCGSPHRLDHSITDHVSVENGDALLASDEHPLFCIRESNFAECLRTYQKLMNNQSAFVDEHLLLELPAVVPVRQPVTHIARVEESLAVRNQEEGRLLLTDFNPQFLVIGEDGLNTFVSEAATAQGLMFLCPGCHARHEKHWLICWFKDRGVPVNKLPGPVRYTVIGASYDNLSLYERISPAKGCWAGSIAFGVVSTVSSP